MDGLAIRKDSLLMHNYQVLGKLERHSFYAVGSRIKKQGDSPTTVPPFKINKQNRLHQNKNNFPSSKDGYEKEKQGSDWENTCKMYIQQRTSISNLWRKKSPAELIRKLNNLCLNCTKYLSRQFDQEVVWWQGTWADKRPHGHEGKKHRCSHTGMAHMKKTGHSKCWWGSGEAGTPLHFCWTFKMIPPIWITAWQFLKKLTIHLPYDLGVPLLGIYPRELKVCIYTKFHLFQPKSGNHPNAHQQINE